MLIRIALGLVALTIAAPLQPLHEPHAPSLYEEMGAAALLAFGALALLVSARGRVLGTPLMLLPLVLIGVIVGHAAAGHYAYPSVPTLLLAIPLLMLLADMTGATLAAKLGSRPVLEACAWAWLLVGLTQVGIQLLQVGPYGMNLWPWVAPWQPGSSRPPSNMMQPNQLATALAFGLCACAYLQARGRLSSFVAAVAAAVLMLGMALSGSRTGLLQAVLFCLLWPTFIVRTAAGTEFGWRSYLRHVLIALALLLTAQAAAHGVSALMGSGIESAIDRKTQLGHAGQLRLALWQAALNIWQAHPWFGVGLDNFAGHQLNHAGAAPLFEASTQAHNLPLQLLAEAGAPATLVFFVLLVSWLVRLRRATLSIETGAVLLMVLLFAAHSLLEFPFAYAYFYIPLLIVMAAVDPARRDVSAAPLVRWSLAALPILLLAPMPILWKEQRLAAAMHAADAAPASSPDISGSSDEMMLAGLHGSVFYAWLADVYVVRSAEPESADAADNLFLVDKTLSRRAWSFGLYRKVLYLAQLGGEEQALDLLARLQRVVNLDGKAIASMVSRAAHRQEALEPFAQRLDKIYGPSTPDRRLGDALP